MKKMLACSLSMMLLLSGCDTHRQLSREIVFVPDVSASIDPEAERQMFVAIEDVAQHLDRGDTLTIIPITGSAEAELQGRTLHYAVPPVEDRQAYDADLRKLNAHIRDDLAQLRADAIAHPGKHTDILGSVRVALKKFSNGMTDKRLIVLSDFIQDDKQFNFEKDLRLSSETDAVTLAHSVAPQSGNYTTINVVLGRLRSSEFAALQPNRQRAINAFWGQVMCPAIIDPDGTAAVLRSSRTK